MKTLIIFTSMALSLMGFAGGGGSSSGGGGSSSSGGGSSFSGGSSYSSSHSSSHSSSDYDGDPNFRDFLFAITVISFVFMSVYLVNKYTVSEKKAKPLSAGEKGQMIASLTNTDYNKTEQEKWIHEEAERIFVFYQEDWGNFNYKRIQNYTTDRYYQHACLMLDAIGRMNRKNVVSDLSVHKVCLFTEVGEHPKLPMSVLTMIKFSGVDEIVDSKTGKTIHKDRASGIVEFWRFIYDGKTLKLEEISQSTESSPHLVENIEKFANDNRLFYSPDWGRLALPTDGLIFNEAGLYSADVNNHVIGRWRNALVQLYTYSEKPDVPDSYYLVGQINVPKEYKGVIIESKEAKIKIKKPYAYQSFKMEWNDFNDRYEVYAASEDSLTAFELLNPSFMERLYERNLPYTLEVVGNTICFFANVSEAREEDYAELFDVLTEAFEELKM